MIIVETLEVEEVTEIAGIEVTTFKIEDTEVFFGADQAI